MMSPIARQVSLLARRRVRECERVDQSLADYRPPAPTVRIGPAAPLTFVNFVAMRAVSIENVRFDDQSVFSM